MLAADGTIPLGTGRQKTRFAPPRWSGAPTAGPNPALGG
jgi:hypothetical protein